MILVWATANTTTLIMARTWTGIHPDFEQVLEMETEEIETILRPLRLPTQQILHKLNTTYLTPGKDGFYHSYRDYTADYGSLLGRKGTFSICARAKDTTTNLLFAIKQNNPHEEEKVDYIHRECMFMSRLPHHKRLVQFLGAALDEYCVPAIEVYFICRLMMELAEGGSLSEWLRDEKGLPISLPVDQSLFYLQQILEGVHFLHFHGVLHLDIKGDNILMFDGGRAIKLGGFGRAAHIDRISIERPCIGGAVACFSSPEVIRDEIPSFSADIWSVMCVLVEMLTAKLPIICANADLSHPALVLLLRTYVDSQIQHVVPINDVDPGIAQIFRSVFKRDPQSRPTALELLNHPRISRAHKYESYFDSEPEQEDSENHFDAVNQAMKRKGALDHTVMQGVFLGPARSGKSSLIKRLTGEGPSSSSPSTGVADEPIHIQVQQSYSIPLCVTDSVWFKLTYNSEAVDLMLRISHFFSSRQKSGASKPPSLQVRTSSRSEVGTPTTTAEGIDFAEVPSPTDPQESQSGKHSSSPSCLPEGYKSPIEILRAAASGEDVSKYLEDSWSLYLTDTGGQMEFQDLLPLLVSGPSVFFITFRLDQDLNQVFTIQYELPDGNKSQPYQSTLTVLEAILQSLASISSMGTFVYKGLQKHCVPIRPKVFLVGTHKDMLDPATASEQIHKIDQYLQKVIKSTSHYRDGLIEFATPTQLIFTVNNLSEDDTDFQKIRSAVENLVQRGEFKMSSPSHWLILSLVLRYLKPRIISFEQCLSVAEKCGISDETELREALHFLHTKLGVVRYFPIEGVGDVVVKDPQVLFDKVTELIVRTFTFENVGKYSTDEFKKKGIFSLRDFERISGDSNLLLTPAHLVKLLQHLRIVAPFQTSDGDTQYFIPCVLAHAKASEASTVNQELQVPPLLVTFKCGYCPKGVAGALIKFLLTNEMKSELEWSLQPDEIFRDQVSILVGPDFDTVVLKIQPTHIKVTFLPNTETTDRTCSVEEVCTEVRESVEKGITSVAADMSYLCDAKHSITFDCPCESSSGHPHTAEMSWYKGKPSKLRCNQTKKSFGLPSGCMVWFGQPLPSPHQPIFPTVHPSTDLSSQHSAAADRSALKPSQLNEAFRLMLPLASEWHNVGILLNVSDSVLKSISKDCSSSVDCLREMLCIWLKQTNPSPTWQTLAEAVQPFDPSLSLTIKNHKSS